MVVQRAIWVWYDYEDISAPPNKYIMGEKLSNFFF